jgi:hypothetical protein
MKRFFMLQCMKPSFKGDAAMPMLEKREEN